MFCPTQKNETYFLCVSLNKLGTPQGVPFLLPLCNLFPPFSLGGNLLQFGYNSVTQWLQNQALTTTSLSTHPLHTTPQELRLGSNELRLDPKELHLPQIELRFGDFGAENGSNSVENAEN